MAQPISKERYSAGSFFSLPQELRLMIYESLLVRHHYNPYERILKLLNHESPHSSQPGARQRLYPNILATCKEVYGAARPIPYGKNTFRLLVAPRARTLQYRIRFLDRVLHGFSEAAVLKKCPRFYDIQRSKLDIWCDSDEEIHWCDEDEDEEGESDLRRKIGNIARSLCKKPDGKFLSVNPRDDLVKMKHLHEKYFHAVRGYAVRASKDGQDDEDDETDEAEDDD
ncbi:MAG: hypothetical protein MMC23_002271 [Stictis urceolatum]|nr:hypothetical protein [Stictis urceolata]